MPGGRKRTPAIHETVLSELGLHVLLVDSTGRITYANPQAESALAAQPGGLRCLIFDSLFSLRNPQWLCHEIRTCAAQGRWSGDAVLCRRDGVECWAHIQAFKAPAALGLNDSVMICFEDITGSIELMSALMKRNEDLFQRNRELEVVNKVGRLLLEDSDLESRLAATLREAAKTIGVSSGIICVKSKDGQRIDLRGVYGLDTAVLATGFSMSIDDKSITAAVVRTGRPRIVEDIAAEPDARRGLAARLGVASAFWVPMIVQDEAIGCMALGDTGARRSFAAQEVTLAQVLANSAASAVRSALLDEAVEVSRAYWQRTFDAISDPILVIDRAGRVLRANAAVASRLNTTTPLLLGEECERVVSGLHRNLVESVISGGRAKDLGRMEIGGLTCQVRAYPLTCRRGETRAVVLHAVPAAAERKLAA